MKKTISFRANDADMDIIERFKMKEGGAVRTLTDADVLRHAIKLLDGEKKEHSAPTKRPENMVIVDDAPEIPEDMPNLREASDMATKKANSEVPHETRMVSEEEVISDILDTIIEEQNPLTDEEKLLGYQWLKGELCDKDGFPIEQLNGDYVRKGGEIYATDPGRSELKEIAKANSEAVVEDTEFGKVNPAMAELLGQSEKVDTLKKHAEPGMLSTNHEGIDEDFNEDNFINE